MKKNNLKNLGGTYAAPEMQLCSIKVEAGFEASMPGVTIDPWEREEGTLEF